MFIHITVYLIKKNKHENNCKIIDFGNVSKIYQLLKTIELNYNKKTHLTHSKSFNGNVLVLNVKKK